MYCEHRWGLIKIDDVWAENFFVIKANLLHDKVHSDRITYKKNTKVLNSVSVYNDKYDLFGVIDAIELTEDKDGVFINGKTYKLEIVEHKPTKPKAEEFNFDDALQVFAQKICVDYIFHTNSTAVLYYSDVKKRVYLPFDVKYDMYLQVLLNILDKMKNYLVTNTIPSINKNQKCSGCSLKDLCLPKVKIPKSVRQEIYRITGGEI